MRGQYDIQQSKNRSCLSSSAEENTRYTRYAAGHEGDSVEIEVRVRDASRRKVPRRELSSRTANVLRSRDDAIARKEEVCLLPGPAQSRACCAFCGSLSWLPLTTKRSAPRGSSESVSVHHFWLLFFDVTFSPRRIRQNLNQVLTFIAATIVYTVAVGGNECSSIVK
jgi:hypothetical protein